MPSPAIPLSVVILAIVGAAELSPTVRLSVTVLSAVSKSSTVLMVATVLTVSPRSASSRPLTKILPPLPGGISPSAQL